LSKICNSK